MLKVFCPPNQVNIPSMIYLNFCYHKIFSYRVGSQTLSQTCLDNCKFLISYIQNNGVIFNRDPLPPAMENLTELHKNKLNHVISRDFRIYHYFSNILHLLMYEDNYLDNYFNRKLFIIEHYEFVLYQLSLSKFF